MVADGKSAYHWNHRRVPPLPPLQTDVCRGFSSVNINRFFLSPQYILFLEILALLINPLNLKYISPKVSDFFFTPLLVRDFHNNHYMLWHLSFWSAPHSMPDRGLSLKYFGFGAPVAQELICSIRWIFQTRPDQAQWTFVLLMKLIFVARRPNFLTEVLHSSISGIL